MSAPPPGGSVPRPTHIAAGTQSSLAQGEVRVVALPRAPDGRPREALVLRDGRGVVRVYLNRCKHLPVPIDSGSRDFLSRDRTHLECKTHGARFRLHDGFCVAGPCSGDSLEPLDFELDGDALYVLSVE